MREMKKSVHEVSLIDRDCQSLCFRFSVSVTVTITAFMPNHSSIFCCHCYRLLFSTPLAIFDILQFLSFFVNLNDYSVLYLCCTMYHTLEVNLLELCRRSVDPFLSWDVICHCFQSFLGIVSFIQIWWRSLSFRFPLSAHFLFWYFMQRLSLSPFFLLFKDRDVELMTWQEDSNDEGNEGNTVIVERGGQNDDNDGWEDKASLEWD